MQLSDIHPDKTYSIREAHEVTNEPKHAIRRLIADGYLPAYKQPGQRVHRIKGRDVLALANGELAA
ncbi:MULTISPECIES: helix-turn-helix domain-containing protein [unclassified Ruegeria]|uniref:helix-turn-helix domain-containing protein n=1 Tax=unclassified Ruegeria TaxID=2625375 RepID=UPI001487BF7C|nr:MULTISPECIES: helix-turn-helix domain-containing protein [unclassified Ruegeria]NOD75819.1 hypothetical protein [Ruegeria sp. HKCCD4332]